MFESQWISAYRVVHPISSFTSDLFLLKHEVPPCGCKRFLIMHTVAPKSIVSIMYEQYNLVLLTVTVMKLKTDFTLIVACLVCILQHLSLSWLKTVEMSKITNKCFYTSSPPIIKSKFLGVLQLLIF